jgi:hypothetical protein
MTLLLAACTPVTSASGGSSQPAPGAAAASAGLCQSIAALPDVSAAERAFTNGAHDALHALASEPRLDRSIAARVLEAMERVHTDFSESPALSVLTDDLVELHASADAALDALGVEVPQCAQ